MNFQTPARVIGGLLLVAAATVSTAQRPVGAGGGAQPGAAPSQVPGPPSGNSNPGSIGQDYFSDAFERADVADGRGRASAAREMAEAMAQAHANRLKGLVDAHPQVLELVDHAPAVRREIIAIDPPAASLQGASQRGYQIVADDTIEGLGTRYVTLRTPAGKSLKKALSELRRIAPRAEFAANHVHVQSGLAEHRVAGTAVLAASSAVQRPAIGIIDGGVAQSPTLPTLTQQGFVRGAPAPDAHATAVASLAVGTGRVHSGSPGTPLHIADIFGNDPKGGNSLALAKALGWMAKSNVPVVLISLVGPPNAIVARAVQQVQARGMHVVAPVGNAGAAAAPMYPASYPGVIAVTGVDARNRALIEAGRGPHIDYAAPGADIVAASVDGKLVKVRGTSFAAPLVAGRLWLASRSNAPIAALDRQAVDLGRKGPDKVFGRGLICGECR